jgi:hypothetical protein
MRVAVVVELVAMLLGGCGGGDSMSVDAAAEGGAVDVAADAALAGDASADAAVDALANAPRGSDGAPPDGAEAPPPSTRQLDLLFMIDNSPSMQQKQANLTLSFPVLIDELKNVPGGLPDLHIGIVSSDLGAGPTPIAGGCGRVAGDRGILQARPGCGLDPAARFMAAGGAVTNFQGDLAQVFGCLASLGTMGCGFEHQLESARVALYERITPDNEGFLRDDALLGLIFLTDEDDCSAEITSDLFTRNADFPGTTSSFRCAQVGHLCNGQQPPIAPFSVPLSQCQAAPSGALIKVADVVESVRRVKRRPDQQILVSGIFGWPADPAAATYSYSNTRDGIDYGPTCTSANGPATAALRMKAFVEAFGAHGSFSSICADDFRPAMQQIGQALGGMLGR